MNDSYSDMAVAIIFSGATVQEKRQQLKDLETRIQKDEQEKTYKEPQYDRS